MMTAQKIAIPKVHQKDFEKKFALSREQGGELVALNGIEFMSKINYALATAVVLMSALLTEQSAQAAQTNINLSNFSFSPPNVVIKPNDSVRWVWVSGTHNTTSSSPGLWDSGNHTAPFFFTNTFPNAGTFPFERTLHELQNMFGSVVVASDNL